MKVSETRTGTTVDEYREVLERAMGDFHYDLLEGLREETHRVMSRTGYLANGLYGQRTARGGVIYAPPGRLEVEQTFRQWEERVVKPWLDYYFKGAR